MNDLIYRRPDDYDLEHEDDDRDVKFYCELVRRLAARRVLELGCGSGRLTIALAELAPQTDSRIVGIDLEGAMLDRAREKAGELGAAARQRLTLLEGDMRSWTADEPFDLVLIPCSSITHLLTLDDRLAAWRRAYGNLRPGGRFVIDITMPNIRAFAESLQTPPRALLEVDSDTTDPETGRRLVRYRATSFDAWQQRATIRFFYDRFEDNRHERYVSDFESHVYFPDELRLLFLHAGFEMEAVYGDYRFREPRSASREVVMVGRRGA